MSISTASASMSQNCASDQYVRMTDIASIAANLQSLNLYEAFSTRGNSNDATSMLS